MVILCNVAVGFGIHTQLMKLIKYVHITPTLLYGHANLCLIMFHITNGLKEGDAYLSLL